MLGPNGAGKTTTILMLLGLSDISDGTARVLGHDPVREPLAVKRRVGYLPDQVGFYDNLSAADNLRYTARLIGLRARRARRENRTPRSRMSGSRMSIDKRVGTFSRGMRQRLGLAEILMKDAQIAILDEPTSGLDPQATLELLDIIRDAQASRRERAAVVASARAGAERVRSRRAVQRGQDRAASARSPSSAGRCWAADFGSRSRRKGRGSLSSLRAVPGVQKVESAGPTAGCCSPTATCGRKRPPPWSRRADACMRLAVEEPSLEAIYTRYFQEHPHEGERHAA